MHSEYLASGDGYSMRVSAIDAQCPQLRKSCAIHVTQTKSTLDTNTIAKAGARSGMEGKRAGMPKLGRLSNVQTRRKPFCSRYASPLSSQTKPKASRRMVRILAPFPIRLRAIGVGFHCDLDMKLQLCQCHLEPVQLIGVEFRNQVQGTWTDSGSAARLALARSTQLQQSRSGWRQSSWLRKSIQQWHVQVSELCR